MASRFAQLFDRLAAAALSRPAASALTPYLEKLHAGAYRITDADIAALKAAGLSEDQIFQATCAGAVDAGLERLKHGLAALENA